MEAPGRSFGLNRTGRHDMGRALTFYRDTFNLEVVQHTSGWSMLRCGGAIIALHILSPGSTESVSNHAGLNLHVPDLKAAFPESEMSIWSDTFWTLFHF